MGSRGLEQQRKRALMSKMFSTGHEPHMKSKQLPAFKIECLLSLHYCRSTDSNLICCINYTPESCSFLWPPSPLFACSKSLPKLHQLCCLKCNHWKQYLIVSRWFQLSHLDHNVRNRMCKLHLHPKLLNSRWRWIWRYLQHLLQQQLHHRTRHWWYCEIQSLKLAEMPPHTIEQLPRLLLRNTKWRIHSIPAYLTGPPLQALQMEPYYPRIQCPSSISAMPSSVRIEWLSCMEIS